MTEYQLREKSNIASKMEDKPGEGSPYWELHLAFFFSLPPSVTLDVGRERNGNLEVSQNLTWTTLFRLEFYIKKDYYSWFADDTCLAK